MKFDNDKLRLIYNAKEQCPEIVLKDSEGNVISSVNTVLKLHLNQQFQQKMVIHLQ